MNDDLKSILSSYVKSAYVMSLSFERGYGLVPARFYLHINRLGKEYRLEIESNFRVLKNGKSILCFDDMFLNIDGHEFSIEEYQSQKGIEKSLLSCNICNFNVVCSRKKIHRVLISTCGDITLFIRPKIELQIINDSHNVDDVLIRLRDCQKTRIFTTNKGTEKRFLSTIFEVRSSKTSDLSVSQENTD